MTDANTRSAGRITHLQNPKPIIISPPSPSLSPFELFKRIGMCISISFCLVCEYRILLFIIHGPSGRVFTERKFLGNPLIAIRFSWRVRRKSRLADKRRSPSGTSGTGHGHETERPSGPVHRSNVQRSDERPHPVRLHSIPERPKNQKGKERERPVVIGDPTVSLFLGD